MHMKSLNFKSFFYDQEMHMKKVVSRTTHFNWQHVYVFRAYASKGILYYIDPNDSPPSPNRPGSDLD